MTDTFAAPYKARTKLRTPNLDQWRDEIKKGLRTADFVDLLMRAACEEQWAVEHAGAGDDGWAEDSLQRAQNIMRPPKHYRNVMGYSGRNVLVSVEREMVKIKRMAHGRDRKARGVPNKMRDTEAGSLAINLLGAKGEYTFAKYSGGTLNEALNEYGGDGNEGDVLLTAYPGQEARWVTVKTTQRFGADFVLRHDLTPETGFKCPLGVLVSPPPGEDNWKDCTEMVVVGWITRKEFIAKAKRRKYKYDQCYGVPAGAFHPFPIMPDVMLAKRGLL